MPIDWTAEATERLRRYEENHRLLLHLMGELRKEDSEGEKQSLLCRLKRVQHDIRSVNMGLAILNPAERRILECLYISRKKYAATMLAEELGCNIKTVYAKKDNGLKLFTIALFGCF